MLAAIAGYTLGELVIVLIIVAGIVAIAWIALKAMGMQLPQWFINILLVIAVVVVAVLAIKFLLSL